MPFDVVAIAQALKAGKYVLEHLVSQTCHSPGISETLSEGSWRIIHSTGILLTTYAMSDTVLNRGHTKVNRRLRAC